jgi:hypothetical protein
VDRFQERFSARKKEASKGLSMLYSNGPGKQIANRIKSDKFSHSHIRLLTCSIRSKSREDSELFLVQVYDKGRMHHQRSL